MYLGTVICALGFLGMSLVSSLPMLYVTVVVGIVLGSSIGFYIPVSVVVATLYRARRSLAFGIFRMGPGLSGLLVPVVGFMIVWWGWRTASVASAVIIVVMGFPLARAIGNAYERGAGVTEPESDTPGRGAAAKAPPPEVSLTLKETLRTRSFWLLAAVMGLRQMVTEGISVHLVILLTDRGWRQEVAASLLGTSAVIGVPARLAFGWMGDFIDKRRLMIGLLGSLSASVLVMAVTDSSAWFMTALVVYSLCYGGLASLQEPIRADYFGIRHFASIQGYSRLFVTAGSVMGSIGAGVLHDLTQSYTVAPDDLRRLRLHFHGADVLYAAADSGPIKGATGLDGPHPSFPRDRLCKICSNTKWHDAPNRHSRGSGESRMGGDWGVLRPRPRRPWVPAFDRESTERQTRE